MDDNSPWKQALLARRKQFEILSANEAPLKCTVFRASGDGRNLLADPRFDDLKNHLHEGSVGQSFLKDSDTIIHALFFGDKTTWERFSSAADESGRIASKIPPEVLAGISGYFYNSTLLCPIAEWSSLIAEISVTIAWSKSRRKVLHPKLPMSVDWKPSMPDFWFIELENVFTASCDSIDLLTDTAVPGLSERTGKWKTNIPALAEVIELQCETEPAESVGQSTGTPDKKTNGQRDTAEDHQKKNQKNEN